MIFIMAKNLDLINIFNTVKDQLVEKQQVINDKDALNHDHGDNMVEIFQAITDAMQAKESADPADQLAYASELLRERTQTGTAQVYANGLAKAAEQITGKSINPETAVDLLETLLNGGEGQSAQSSSSAGNLIGTLLNTLTGQESEDNNLDVGDLLTTGMAFLQAKKSGESDVEALVSAMVSSSLVGQKPHRAESGEVVAKSVFQAIGSLFK